MKSRFLALTVFAITALFLLDSTNRANAAVIFDFDGLSGGNNGQQIVRLSDGITMTVTPGRFDPGPAVTTPFGDIFVDGEDKAIGVRREPPDDSTVVDGKDFDELLLTKYDVPVEFISFELAAVQRGTNALLFLDTNNDNVLDTAKPFVVPAGPNFQTIQVSSIDLMGLSPTGMLFGIGTEGDQDQLRLRKTEVQKAAVVPEPATISLLPMGLAGIGFLVWRKRRRLAR